MDQNTQELYGCNGCKENIAIDRARIHCHTCPDFHLCANCFVIKQFSRPHTESHSTMVLKVSGYVVPSPPGFPPRPKPALPPRHNSRETMRGSEMPTANWGALWNIMKAPLEKKDKKSRKGSDEVKGDDFKNVDVHGRSGSMSGGLEDKGKDPESSSTSPLSQNPVNTLPPSPPKSVRQGIERIDSSAPSYPIPVKWEPLFEADGTPTPIFVVLMSTLFGHLDPDHTGCLRPETYSAFLDVQGCDLEENSWKRTLGEEDTGMTREMADFELGLYFSENNISHILSVRMKTSATEDSEEPTSAVEKRIRQSISFKPNMPMLSRQGFIDLMNIEYHKDLDQAHEYLNRAINAYGIWNGLGEMPRDVLPEQSISTALKSAKITADSEPPELKSFESKSVESKSTELQLPEFTVAEKTSEAQAAVEEKEEPDLLPRSMPLILKGGEAKVEALLKNEEFDQGVSSNSDETEEKQSPDKTIEADGGKDSNDEKSKSVGAFHAKVEEESPELKSPKSNAHDSLYKED